MKSLMCVAVIGAAVVAGCKSKPPADIADGARYPEAKQSAVLNVHVLRDGTKISMTNTSARAFAAGEARMWINQWYSRELPAWGPGEILTLKLTDFRDRYGSPFKAGGFWATENPEKVVLAQIESKGEVVGLVVIGEAE